jgi:penicillin-binding protein 1B
MKLETYQPGTPTPKTVVLQAPSKRRSASIALIETLQSVWDRVPARVKSFGAWWVQPRVLLPLGALMVCVLAIGLHYYGRFSKEIDSRLKRDALDNSAQLVGAPVRINRGERFSIEELSSHLGAAGYAKSAGEATGTQGSYSVVDRTIEVVPSVTATSTLGVQPARIKIDEKQRISALTGSAGQRLSSVILEGPVLASLKDGDRRKKIQVQFSEIPAVLLNAVTATEDQRFFDHNGIDWRGICRALWIDLQQGEIVQGGSTITQQLIKNSFLTNERSWRRKVKEAAMALILESRLSKEEIFALYCNDVYLGQSGRFAIRGFAEAADVYFDKTLQQLTLAQSAFLAGLVHAPNRYSAHRDLSDALARRAKVLDAMVELNSISVEEADAAKLEPLQFVKRETKDDHGVSYFIDYTERFVQERYGWRALASETYLSTTLDMRLQKAAYDSVALHGERLDRLMARSRKKGTGPPPAVQAALVALDPHSGEVLAMIGGRNYDESQLNRATDALRQPGSTFKPFIYASALSQRSYTAATLLSDRPQSFSYEGGTVDYEPSNYGGTFGNRDVTLGEALARSLNVPTVELALRVGLATIADFAETCGLPKPRIYPSMALGASEVAPLDLAAGYTAFANYGTARRPTPVKAISWPEANRSEEVPSTSARALSPEMAYLMTNMLSSVVNGGTGSRVRTMGFKENAAGKTGTSRDGWFVGYTPNLVCAVWVGFDDNRDLGLKGSDSALPIWVDFMKRALAIRPELGGTFKQPGGLTSASIDPTTGLLASVDCPTSRQMLFLSGTEPIATCAHESAEDLALVSEESAAVEQGDDEQFSDQLTLEVCAVSGLLPSSACKNLKQRTVKWREIPLGICGPEFHEGRRVPPLTPDKPSGTPDKGESTKPSDPRSPVSKKPDDVTPP